MTLNVTAGEPGQVITAYLNKSGTAVPLTSVDHTFTHTFTGLGLKNSFDVTVTAPDGITKRDYYVNITGKEIIGFYFEFNGNGKYYGIKTDTPDAEANSGSISGDAITVNVPYRYRTELINNMPEITASGNSFSPQDSWGTNLTSHKKYTITAVDGTTRDYLVTVNVAEPIYVTGSLESEDEITFSKGEVPSTTDDTLIILIDNNDSFTGWNIGIKSGNDTINTYSTHTFDAPSAPGSYNVTVRFTLASTEEAWSPTGSFTLLVE
jgi:hypothetical protein